MIFVRRDSTASIRFVWIRVIMLFAAVALFFVGVRMGEDLFTMVAMAIAIVAILIGLAARRTADRSGEGD